MLFMGTLWCEKRGFGYLCLAFDYSVALRVDDWAFDRSCSTIYSLAQSHLMKRVYMLECLHLIFSWQDSIWLNRHSLGHFWVICNFLANQSSINNIKNWMGLKSIQFANLNLVLVNLEFKNYNFKMLFQFSSGNIKYFACFYF